MPTEFTIDVIDGADHTKTRGTDGIVRYTATRLAIVRGLTDGSAGQAANALVRARAVVEAAYPLYTAYDASVPMCYLVGYRSEGLTEDSDGARVRLIYDTPIPGGSGGSGTPFVMTDNTETQYLSTQLDPLTGEALWVKWTDPLNAANTYSSLATVTLPYKIRVVTLDAILATADMPLLRGAAGGTNDDEWAPDGEDPADFPRGFWAFDAFRSSTIVGAVFFRVHCELKTKVSPKEDWGTFAMCRDPATGHFVADRDAAVDLNDRTINPYKYGVRAANGIIKVGGLIPVQFDLLFPGI